MTSSYLPTTHEMAGSSDRGFGFTVGGILLGIAAFRWIAGTPRGASDMALIAIGSALVLLAAAAPYFLSLPNRLWTKLGQLLFKIANPVVMLLIYVTTFIPIGFFLRLRGKRLLNVEIDRNAASYWQDRRDDAFPASKMTNQF